MASTRDVREGRRQAIAATEGQYDHMWAQDATAMQQLAAPAQLAPAQAPAPVITMAGAKDTLTPPPSAIAVHRVCALVPYPELDQTMRLSLASVNYAYRLDMTSSLLDHSHAVLNRWRDPSGGGIQADRSQTHGAPQ